MSEGKRQLLNRLLADSPPGSLLPTRWLTANGYADNLLPKYVAGGWLASAGRGVYRRTGADPTWVEAVYALQALLDLPLHVGGLSALDWRGFAHYLRPDRKPVYLYGPRRPPKWAAILSLDHPLEWRSDRLFAFPEATTPEGREDRGLIRHRPMHGRHELWFASEERAFLELLDEVPMRTRVQEAHAVLQSLAGLRPGRLSTLLTHCRSFKVKRLFLALAHRHGHSWLRHLDLSQVDLGRGKRVLVPGGKLDSEFQITLPADLDADLG